MLTVMGVIIKTALGEVAWAVMVVCVKTCDALQSVYYLLTPCTKLYT